MKLTEDRGYGALGILRPQRWWSSRRGRWREDAEAWRNGTLPEDVAAASLAKEQGTTPHYHTDVDASW